LCGCCHREYREAQRKGKYARGYPQRIPAFPAEKIAEKGNLAVTFP
jgi:hypothetical protein